MLPEEVYAIDKPQPEVGFKEVGIKEILLKVAYEQVGIGRGHMGAHVRALELEEIMGIEGKIVVGEDKMGELEKELIRCWGMRGGWLRKCSRTWRTCVWGLLVYKE